MPQVSIIVPVYNAERFLERCIKSVQRQTLADWELVLINDASTDGSITIIKTFAEKDPRIKWFDNKVNQGPMVVRQQGVMEATGEYVTFLDSDDALTDKALEKFLQSALSNKADVVCANMLHLGTKGYKMVFSSSLKYGNDRNSALKSLLRMELTHNLCGKLFRRRLLQDYEYRVFPEARRGEDACMLYQIANNAQIVCLLDEPVYLYYEEATSSSHKEMKDSDLKSLFLANHIIIETCSNYPELQEDLFCRISKSISALIAQGYGKRPCFHKAIKDFSMERYIEINEMWKILKFSDFLEIVIKRFVFPAVGLKFDGWK